MSNKNDFKPFIPADKVIPEFTGFTGKVKYVTIWWVSNNIGNKK